MSRTRRASSRHTASQLAPVAVVGAGPVGVRLAQELLRRDPMQPVVLYGAERWEPYNRVHLPTFLAGECGWTDLINEPCVPPGAVLDARYHCPVVSIDRMAQTVTDAAGRV